MSVLHAAFLRAPIAHRALHDVAAGRPENSRAAIRAAIAQGYGIEIDLQLSRDGQAMVFHDYDLRRLTGKTGAVRRWDADALRRVPLLGGDEGIPTFAEVLDLVAGRVPILVELKDQHGQMSGTDGNLEEAAAWDLAGYDGPVAVMSFNPEMVARLAELAPGVPRGITSCSFPVRYWPLLRREVRQRLAGIPDYARTGSVFISHEAGNLHSARVAELKSQGAAVLCWTVRSPEEEARAREIANNITFEGYLAGIPA